MKVCVITFIFGVIGCAAGWSAEPARAPLPPPPPSSPIEHFRKILAMSPAGRESALAGRSEEVRRFVFAKLKEFDELSPAERENRLRTLEMRWHLLALMKTPSTNRQVRLLLVPERDRQLVEERLRLWDDLPPDEQTALLESEPAMSALSRTYPGGTRSGPLSIITTQQQARIDRSVQFIKQLSPEKQQRIYRNFETFFELSEKERDKALDALSEAERKRMEQTLQAFEKLPKAEREQCIAGMQKFTTLSREERDQFWRNAERWQAMSAKDREIWRNLVNRKAFRLPPLPPGVDVRQPAPSVSSSHGPDADSAVTQTNRH